MKNIIILLLTISVGTSCTPKRDSKKSAAVLPDIAVKASGFETTIDGKEVKLFNLSNKNGMVVQITNFGAAIVSIILPSGNGKYTDVAIGYPTLDQYRQGGMSAGVIVGRFANRISGGSFEIDGAKYQLEVNRPPNTLHSGSSNYAQRVWDAAQEDNSVILSLLSPDMDGGFPGELAVNVRYTLTDDNRIEMVYEAETTKKTVINLTNHSYFNMAGEGSGDILDQLIKVNADYITPVSPDIIPTGELMAVEGSPFDLREEVAIGKMIEDEHEQLKLGKGYDHNWVLNKEVSGELTFAASLRDATTGLSMKVYTTEPGIQVYTGNFFDGTYTGKSGKKYDFRNAVALETQHFPDSPNKSSFPSTILEPGEKYYHKTVLEFDF